MAQLLVIEPSVLHRTRTRFGAAIMLLKRRSATLIFQPQLDSPVEHCDAPQLLRCRPIAFRWGKRLNIC
jgi:hypothetical protein